MRRKPNRLFSMPENNIRSVKQNPFTPPAASPTELTTYIGTPPDDDGGGVGGGCGVKSAFSATGDRAGIR
ncbi:hypothetical protein JCM12107_10260 [Corynebacterium simulans]